MLRSFSLFTFLMIFIFLGLGTWQLQRKTQKEALLAEIAQGQQRTPQNVDISPHPAPFTPAYAEGHFLPGKTISLQSKVHKGKNGFYILDVLQTQKGQFLLIQRGWVPKEIQEVPTGKLKIEGIVRTPSPPTYFQPDNVAPTYFWIDLKALSQDLNLPLLPFYLVSKASFDPRIELVPPLPSLPNNHLQYAIIWFLLAFLLGIMLLYRKKYY